MQRLLTAFFILLLLLTLFPNHKTNKSFAENLTPSPTSAPAIQVEYDLPYPGILPDNPLYFVKAIRDNLVGFFITDPLKKAEYCLLMADKRIASAQSLLSEGKDDLAITTLSKSGNYFDQAIQKIAEAKKQGEETRPLVDKMITASKKHQQIILQMEQIAKGDTRYNLELLFVRSKNFEETVKVIKAD